MATPTDKTTKRKQAAAAAKARAAKLATVTKGQGSGFMSFVREQGVVGLAVGLAIGTAAGASVKVIVDQLISPLVGLLTRGVNLNDLHWVILSADKNNAEVAIGWGPILSSIITLVATAFIVYLIVHLAKLDRMDKSKD